MSVAHRPVTCTVPLHSHALTLLVAAVLTPIPLTFVDYTIPRLSTCVRQVLPHRTLEKTLAALAAANTEMNNFSAIHSEIQKCNGPL
jgi:hypothetical protein